MSPGRARASRCRRARATRRKIRQESRQQAPCGGLEQAWAIPSNKKCNSSHVSVIFVRAKPRPPRTKNDRSQAVRMTPKDYPLGSRPARVQVQASNLEHLSVAWLGPLTLFILKHQSGRRKKRMPRIKQLLAAGQVVRVFAAGQLLSPKLIEIVGEHGEFENSRCLEAIETIARTCAEANKPWGVFSRGPGYAERMRDLGCRLLVLASDIHTVHAGIRTAKERYEVFFPGR